MALFQRKMKLLKLMFAVLALAHVAGAMNDGSHTPSSFEPSSKRRQAWGSAQRTEHRNALNRCDGMSARRMDAEFEAEANPVSRQLQCAFISMRFCSVLLCFVAATTLMRYLHISLRFLRCSSYSFQHTVSMQSMMPFVCLNDAIFPCCSPTPMWLLLPPPLHSVQARPAPSPCV
jgi:hypothetical protein